MSRTSILRSHRGVMVKDLVGCYSAVSLSVLNGRINPILRYWDIIGK